MSAHQSVEEDAATEGDTMAARSGTSKTKQSKDLLRRRCSEEDAANEMP